jgi:hypothetical protein
MGNLCTFNFAVSLKVRLKIQVLKKEKRRKVTSFYLFISHGWDKKITPRALGKSESDTWKCCSTSGKELHLGLSITHLLCVWFFIMASATRRQLFFVPQFDSSWDRDGQSLI